MYADRIEAGSKRSVKDRLNGGLDDDYGQNRPAIAKRQHRNDDKWKHDLFHNAMVFPAPGPKVGPKDLRLKLQKKVSQQAYEGGKGFKICDLREKLSGIIHPKPPSADISKPTLVSDISKVIRKNITAIEATLPETKMINNPASSQKKSQQKNSKQLRAERVEGENDKRQQGLSEVDLQPL